MTAHRPPPFADPGTAAIHAALVANGFVLAPQSAPAGDAPGIALNPNVTRQQPVLVAAGDPLTIVWANPAACALFTCTTLAELTAAFNRGSSLTSPTLIEGAAYLSADRLPPAPPRLERLRFLIGALPETIAFMVRTLPGPAPLIVFSALDVRSALLARMPVTAPIAMAAPAQTLEPAQILASDPASASADAPRPGSLESAVRAPTPLRSVAAVRADLQSQFGDAPSQRFVWKTDAQGILVEISSQLEACVGATAAHLTGQPFLASLNALHLDPEGKVAAAFASQGTWSRLNVCWPVAGSEAALPVSLGALPMFTRDKRFDGYQGYGLIDLTHVTMDHRPSLQPAAPPQEDILARIARQPAPSLQASTVLLFKPGQHSASATPILSWLEPLTDEPVLMPPVPVPAPTSAPTLVPPASDTTPNKPSDTSPASLSDGERQAFGEIARTLISSVPFGAKTPLQDPDVAAPDAPPEQPQLAEQPQPAKSTHALELLRRVVEASANWTQADALAEPPPDASATPPTPSLATNVAGVFDHLPVGVVIAQANRAVFANAALLKWLSFESLAAYLSADGLSHMFKGREPTKLLSDTSGTVPLVGRTGTVVMLHMVVSATMWNNEPADLLTFRQDADLTPKLQALELDLQKVRASNRELHAILDTATDGVAVLDEKGRILSLNKSGQALFGCEQNDVAGESFTSLLQPESEGLAQTYFEGLRDNGVASMLNDGRNVLGRAQQGGVIPLFITIGRVGGAATPTYCAVLRDMTAWQRVELDLREARREAEKVSALKSDFLAKVSHEIRTPLNAILGFAEVMMEERLGEIGNARYKDYLKDIHTSGSHVMSLVNDLLDLSKIEAGKMDLDSLPLDANKIINECASLMQLQANAERVIVRMSLAQRLPLILGDERSLRQIVLNLLSNAVKFNEPGGQVIISSALSDSGSVVLRIRDTGIGMSEADLALALEPFRQVVSSRRLTGTGRTGTGLGLPLTKALVEANRAQFSIKSQAREGTLVEVTFPPSRVLTNGDVI